MRQALHIFKKDVRQHWYLILLVLGLTAAFAATSAQRWYTVQIFPSSAPDAARPLIPPDVNDPAGLGGLDSFSTTQGSLFVALLVIAWWLLIARAVHAEALVGTRQFWLTRPYSRWSLWAAKAMLVLAVVNLPLLVAQAAIIRADDLPLAPDVAGLLWDQVLMTAAVLMPAMSVAALTRTTTQFVFVILATAFGLGPGIQLIQYALTQTGLMHQSVPEILAHDTDALAWVPLAAGVAVIAVTGCGILLLQYARRRTAAARAVAVVGCACSIGMFELRPWASLFQVQSIFTAPARSLTAEMVRPQPRTAAPYGVTDTLALPVRITGVPSGTLLACEAVSVTLDNGAGGVWNSGLVEYGSRLGKAPNGCSVRVEVDNTFFKENRDRHVLLRGALYVTLFGVERTASIAPDFRPVEVPGAGMCRANPFQAHLANVLCRVAFRWPRRVVWARDDAGDGTRLTPTLSYSPFPADLVFDPVDNYHTAAPADPRGVVTVVSQEPTAHVRLEAELREVRLGDLEWGVR